MSLYKYCSLGQFVIMFGLMAGAATVTPWLLVAAAAWLASMVNYSQAMVIQLQYGVALEVLATIEDEKDDPHTP